LPKRIVVNYATDSYHRGQIRLSRSLQQFDPTSFQLFFSDIPNSPPHQEKPYAFKAHALAQARDLGADLVLWCDASIVVIRELNLLWAKIERDGYWIARNGWNNYEWTARSAYPDLFPVTPLEEARELNKRIPHVVATAFGLDLESEIGAEFLAEYYRLAQTNAFCGPWRNDGSIGPPDVLGHRHDQTAASVVAWRLGMKLTDCPEIFSYPPGAESTILLADGGFTHE
jgi:hypothetical protein